MLVDEMSDYIRETESALKYLAMSMEWEECRHGRLMTEFRESARRLTKQLDWAREEHQKAVDEKKG